MITASQIEVRFNVNPETGNVKRINWYDARPTGFIKPGNQATGGGYKLVGFRDDNGKLHHVRIHHLVWMWVHGEWLKGEIDHINGNRQDNRISNLRLVTVSQNRTNKTIQSNNKSGFKWVHWCKQRKLWCAEIIAPKSMGIGRKRLYCSFHKTPEDAHEAACSAAKILHGEFFNPGYNT